MMYYTLPKEHNTNILGLSRIVKEKSINYHNRGDVMISYEPFYATLKRQNISTYKLITHYGISRSLIHRLKHNKPISTITLNDLCSILHCPVEDVLLFTEDE